MSCIRKTKIFNEVKEVEVEYANKSEIDNLISSIKDLLVQKFNKLNILVKNMNLTIKGYQLIVKDEYGICSSLEDIAKSFGFKIKSLDKHSYVISDQWLELLNQLDEPFKLSSIFNKAHIVKDKIQVQSTEIIDIIKNIRTISSYVYKQTNKVKRIYYDDEPDYFEYEYKTKTNKDLVIQKITKYINDLSSKLKQSNVELTNGTVALIKYRAKQLGYNIKQNTNKDNVQLVLERID